MISYGDTVHSPIGLSSPQLLVQTLEVRETRIIALRRDIESGHYSVKADQVAEKIVKDHFLELFDY